MTQLSRYHLRKNPVINRLRLSKPESLELIGSQKENISSKAFNSQVSLGIGRISNNQNDDKTKIENVQLQLQEFCNKTN